MNFPKAFLLLTLAVPLIFPITAFSQPSAPERAELRDAIKSLASEDQKAREKAMDQLLASSYRDPSLISELLPLLEDPVSSIRERSIRLMGEIGDRKIIPALRPLLNDPVASVRIAAAKTLAALDAQEAVPDLQRLLTDASPEVVLQAIQSLQVIGDEKAVDPLVDLMVNGDSYRLRSAAIRALGEIRSPRPVNQMIVLLEYERDIWLRLEIARALSKIGDDDAIKPLMRVLDEVRKEANQQSNERRKNVYIEAATEFEKEIAALREQSQKKPAARKIAKKPLTPAAPQAKPPTKMELPKPVAKKKSRPAKRKTQKIYCIQIKATPNGDLARALLENLKGKGQKDAYITPFQKDNEQWYRVRLGTFSSIDEANTYALNLKHQKVIEEYFVAKK